MAGFFSSLTDGLGVTNYGGSRAAIDRAAGYYEGIQAPELRALELEQVGEMSPEEARAFLSEGTAYEDISVDPRLAQAQKDVLGDLQLIADEGGLTAEDRSFLSQIASQERTQERGAREAILQGAAERGVGGSGLELQQQLIAQQESAGRQSERDLSVAAMAQKRKREALQQSAQLAGNIRGQEYGEQAQLASARDAIDRFNLANQQNVEFTNVGARNQAQQFNLQTAQDIANKRAIYDAGLDQQRFQNQMMITEGRAQSERDRAKNINAESAANMGAMAGFAQAAAYGMASDENVKENIEIAPEQIDDLLNNLTGFKYDYKDPEKHGEGKRMGVMAQDVEQSEMGKELVSEDEEGVKRIDTGKSVSAILAGLARMNERLNKVEEE